MSSGRQKTFAPTHFFTLLFLPILLMGGAGAAQANPEGEAEVPAFSFLASPAAVLEQEPTVVLTRNEPPLTLHVVTDGKTDPGRVAERYGVSPKAIRRLGHEVGSRLLEVRLPESRPMEMPLRPASVQTYFVRQGDTLAGVAARFGLRVVDLLGVNLEQRSLDHLHLGDQLNIPTRETGVLVRIKPGQTALSLIAGYGADLVATARANGVLPTELHVGDELLLPGVQADGFQQQLLARREKERQAEAALERQRQYERFLAWQDNRKKQRLEEKYRVQAQYERYQAWKTSAERQRQIAAYERQVQFEAAQAAQQVRERQAAQRAAAASVVATSAKSAPRLARNSGRMGWPMRSFRLTSRYGDRDIAFHRAVFHGGIDLAAAYGSPVYAATDGTVTRNGYGDYGLNVYTTSGDSTVIYGHMSRTAVDNGEAVQRGQIIGYVGCTGICTGPHLHFEVRIGGQTVNPLAMLP